MTSSVTDAAVEAACKGYWPHHWPKHMADQDRESIGTHMRAALEAYNAHVIALSPPPVSEMARYAVLMSVINERAYAQMIRNINGPFVCFDQAEAREAGLLRQLARAEAEKDGLLLALKHHTGFDHGIMAIRALVERATAAEAKLAALEVAE